MAWPPAVRNFVCAVEDLEGAKAEESGCDSHHHRALFLLGISIVKFVADYFRFIRDYKRCGSGGWHSKVEHGFRCEELSNGRSEDSPAVSRSRVGG